MSDERRSGYITWSALMDAGLTHVDVLNRGRHDVSEWIVKSFEGHALVRVRLNHLESWVVEWFVRAGPHPGATSTATEWRLEESRTYLGGEVPQMLADIAATVG